MSRVHRSVLVYCCYGIHLQQGGVYSLMNVGVCTLALICNGLLLVTDFLLTCQCVQTLGARISFHNTIVKYLIHTKIRAPLNFAHLIFAHPQISRPFNFCAPLFYCKFAHFSFIRGIVSSPFNFCAFVLRELAPFDICV